MGVIPKLNALDEKSGVVPPLDVRIWHRSARQWWLHLVLSVVWFVLAVFADKPGLALPAVAGGFVSGFFYNERLRMLGRTSRIPAYRRPDDLP